ncbi:substrate-binding periplasmic protein [Noviherbaspirillum sp.]|mgnify:CR=1 FL=1|uniref:substrate-binding periplasmic protein n=1 Tax=Noviherbaspirillum sp. TaxID=1926288 RepID=UPI002FDF9686
MHLSLRLLDLPLRCGAHTLLVSLFVTCWAIKSSAASDLIFLRTAAQLETGSHLTARAEDGMPFVSSVCPEIYLAIERMDPGLRFVVDHSKIPAGRLDSALMLGEVDIACGLPKSAEHESAVFFIGPPLFTARFHLVARADDPVSIGSWDDVRMLGENGVILSMQAYGAVKRLRAVGGLHIDHGASDAIGNVRKLHAKRARFFFHLEPGISNIIRDAGFEDKVRVLPTVMDVQPLYLVVSKKLSEDVVAKLRHAMNRLNATGELSRISEKWQVYR